MTKWHLLIPIMLALGASGGIGESRGATLESAPAVSDRPAPGPAQRDASAQTIEAKPPATTAVAASAPLRDEEAALALLPKYSPQWWARHDAIEAEADARLAKALIICSGCFSPGPDDQTGSIK
jgi:hypothetical protein